VGAAVGRRGTRQCSSPAAEAATAAAGGVQDSEGGSSGAEELPPAAPSWSAILAERLQALQAQLGRAALQGTAASSAGAVEAPGGEAPGPSCAAAPRKTAGSKQPGTARAAAPRNKTGGKLKVRPGGVTGMLLGTQASLGTRQPVHETAVSAPLSDISLTCAGAHCRYP
jgi:hypothetical protein